MVRMLCTNGKGEYVTKIYEPNLRPNYDPIKRKARHKAAKAKKGGK